RRSSAPAAAAGVTTVVPTPVAPTQPKTLIGVVTEFVGSVLQSLLNPGSGSPMQIPILTAVLSFVRTELERFFFPRNANAAPQQTVTLITDPPSAAVDPTQQHVLVIGVDGTNLSRILADDYNQNFLELIGTSTTAASSIVGHTTISNPSWTSILTGFWGERTGVINNVFTPWTYEKYTTVFNQLETLNRDIDTMAVADWDVINAIAGAGSLYADDNRYVPQLDGDTNWLATDDRVAAVTIDALAGDDAPNFLFSYYVGVDENGHMYGGDSLEYKLAIRNMDDNLGDILDAVDVWEAAHPGEEWTIIVVTDHGHQPQQGFGHGFQSPDETATFVIADGPDFKDGYVNSRYQIVDVTPTVVSLFGGTPVSGSDGVPLTTLAGGDEHPDDLKSALQAEIAKNKSPDFLTDAALTLRTIFSTVPYYVYTFGNDLTAGLPSFLQLPVKLLFDGLYVATNVPAQIVAFLTGVSGARIFPLLPPAPPNFPPSEDATLLESRVPVCGLGSTSAAEPSCTAEVLV
ncbi:MAG: alkaline phosphatase family protein, partial [Mycobacterium sp.]